MFARMAMGFFNISEMRNIIAWLMSRVGENRLPLSGTLEIKVIKKNETK